LVALLCLIACGVAGFFYFVWGNDTPVTEADDSLAKVQSAGKIVIGTSADYPPFEYYVSNFQIDGFDIALMNEVANRLGVQPEYRNFAFDGLNEALQLGQIDAAIAAISVTPDREAEVDFTNTYYVTTGALLTSIQSGLAVNQLQDVAGRRVGVQSGSVYESWAKENLVEPGILPLENLYVYQQSDQAVADLGAGRLDFMVLDLPPAEKAVESGGYAIAGEGVNYQRFAIALPKGSNSLKAEIDRILAELHTEGKIAELAKNYLGVDELLPTPTPTAPPGPDATATPVPPPVVCIDGLALVEHLSFDDQNMSNPPVMQPGQPFTKGWRVRNVGTCTWDTGYQLVYAHGNDPAARMSGEPVQITREVPPGDTFDIQINLIAPIKPGTYQAFWQMTSPLSGAFGERLPVGITVPAAPTATPPPTATPVPGVTFTVDRTNIKQGECVNFYWKVENVREVYFYPQGADWRKYGVAGEANKTECPSVTTTYELRVVNLDGSVNLYQKTINVEPVAGAPVIAQFTVDPNPQITVGQCVTVRWKIDGEVNTIRITANNATLWDGAPKTGNLQDCPPGAGAVNYLIDANGPGGTSRQQRTINVVNAATATPVPTPAPEAPVVYSFDVNPNEIEVNGNVNITWSTGGGTTRVVIKRNNDTVYDGPDLSGNYQQTLNQPGQVTFRIEAYNNAGNVDSREETITVHEAIPDNPLADTHWSLLGTIDGTSITASFGADWSLNGSSGCNSYSARYTVNGNNITVSGLGTGTQMLCPDDVMAQEQQYLQALQAATSYQISNKELTLSSGLVYKQK